MNIQPLISKPVNLDFLYRSVLTEKCVLCLFVCCFSIKCSILQYFQPSQCNILLLKSLVFDGSWSMDCKRTFSWDLDNIYSTVDKLIISLDMDVTVHDCSDT